VQRRLDADPNAMRRRRETVEHPFGTIKARMGATHFLTRTMPKVATEMALAVLAYNFTRVVNILGVKPLIAAMRPEVARMTLQARCPRLVSPSAFSRSQDPNLPSPSVFVPANQIKVPIWAHRSITHRRT